MKIARLLALLLVAMAALRNMAHAQTLDPHASFFDVSARRASLDHNADVRVRAAMAHLDSCASSALIPAPPSPVDIPRHYLNGSHGPTNPAEAAATRVYGAYERRIAAGTNQYIATGSQAEARCALDQLDAWAQAAALTNYDAHASSQAWFQSGWTLCASSIAESILVDDPGLDHAKIARVNQWLNTAAHKLISWEKPGEPGNNLHYWRALAATATGVVTGDRQLFDFGLHTFREAIGELDTSGALPREMERHERSLHYQAFALAPLTMIAEFAARQHVDLYAYTAHGRTLRDAIIFFGRALADPSLIRPYTTETQDMHFGAGDFSWADVYAHRFGTTGLPSSITDGLTHPTNDTRIGGSMTILDGAPSNP